jgi:peroxiredoxin
MHMKKLNVLMLVGMAGLMAFAPGDTLKIGDKMPKGDVKMMDVSGKEITLKEAAGAQGLLVMFSCNTCPYVVKNEDRSRDILSYAKSKGIGVAVLNSNEAYRSKEDSYEAMQAYAQKQHYQWYYTVDKNHVIADAFGANRTPEVFLFDADGKLVYHGAIDDSPADAAAVKRMHLREAINQMTNGKDVEVKTSRSIGCNIKRLG